MITIHKHEEAPTELIEVQESFAEELFQKKDKFWKGKSNIYSPPTKESLKKLYHNKCAFCEIELTESDADNKFTIEHYRPKEYYFWLGLEWTNLFPTCTGCNNNKGNDFPLFSERNKIKIADAPFDDSGRLVLEKCKSNHPSLLAEQPSFLHPEIDNPEKYFRFEASGKAVIKEGLTKQEQDRASKMLSKFINRFSIEEKRKRKIIKFRNRLVNLLNVGIPALGKEYTERDIKLLFLGFFEDLYNLQKPDTEFSLLGYDMLVNFNIFFLDYIEKESSQELRHFTEYAYNLCINKE